MCQEKFMPISPMRVNGDIFFSEFLKHYVLIDPHTTSRRVPHIVGKI